MFLPDSNTCIFLMRKNKAVQDRWRARSRSEVFLSPIVAYELAAGPHFAPARYKERERDNVRKLIRTMIHLPFTSEDGEAAAEVRVTLKKQGNLIGPYDLLLAGQALARGFTLVTNNTGEFSRVEGLKLLDWYEPD